jgi:hypothetical protein
MLRIGGCDVELPFRVNEAPLVETAVACHKLAAVRQYSAMPSRVTEEFIETTTAQRWFQERVFDMFLWNPGGRKVTSAIDAGLTSHP